LAIYRFFYWVKTHFTRQDFIDVILFFQQLIFVIDILTEIHCYLIQTDGTLLNIYIYPVLPVIKFDWPLITLQLILLIV